MRRIAHEQVARNGAKKSLPMHYLKVQTLGKNPYVNLSMRKDNESYKKAVRVDKLVEELFGSNCNNANDIK